MKEIGGYPSLELRSLHSYHRNAIALNTARNCIEFILMSKKYSKVYVPYYTCTTVIEPFIKTSTPYEFYHVDNNLAPISIPKLNADEAFFYTNYFGIKDSQVKLLAKNLGSQLIVDNAQAFYSTPIVAIDTVYSARKFFGVSDGAYLYANSASANFERDYSFNRMMALIKRLDLSVAEGYQDFQEIEIGLCNQPIRQMSRLTEAILKSIDYEAVRQKRRRNFETLNRELYVSNHLIMPSIDEINCPMVYPYLTDDKDLRKRLLSNKIFVATYWPNIFDWCDHSDFEYNLAQNLLPLPIDQRYGEDEMIKIIEIIRS